MSATTAGLVCAHHHLYSALARGMPAPPKVATSFQEILEQVWWRLDTALDLEMIRWSAMLGALEALENGTTAIIDHRGQVTGLLPRFTRGSLVGAFEGREGLTPYARWAAAFGLWPLWLLALVVVGWAVWSARR